MILTAALKVIDSNARDVKPHKSCMLRAHESPQCHFNCFDGFYQCNIYTGGYVSPPSYLK